MEWLNYHHLLYFWLVARRGTVAAASAELGLAPPTISAQIRTLEDTLGAKLLQRSGRRLVLTEVGQMVMPYAEEIFSLGRELNDAVKGRSAGRHLRLAVGVTDAVPKDLAYRLIAPALQLDRPVQVVCHESSPPRLLAELAVHELDLVIADSPAGPDVRIRLFNHFIGESGVSFFATPKVAAKYRSGFPKSLDGAPLLLLGQHGGIRPQLDQWLEALGIHPQVTGRFDDFAMSRVFAENGRGIVPAPAAIEPELVRRRGLVRVGHTDQVRYSYYVISIDSKIQHPAIRAIRDAAQQSLLQPARKRPAGARP